MEPREGGIVRLWQAQSCSVSLSKIVTSIVVDLIVSESAVPYRSENELPQQKSGVQGIRLPACKEDAAISYLAESTQGSLHLQ